MQVNWAAIKKRNLSSEKPRKIALDFGLTAKQVSNKAKRENWKSKKEQIEVKIEEKIVDEVAALRTLAINEIKTAATMMIFEMEAIGRRENLTIK